MLLTARQLTVKAQNAALLLKQICICSAAETNLGLLAGAVRQLKINVQLATQHLTQLFTCSTA
jgi:hypothetical protein